ncbi:2-oxoglutarate dehydrogenase complex dihydrolipoyllysine-residue succinyltransferase [Puniceicoccales bacterium CK1056]|uniref:Dihydrolipoyllysine-residue succinyltransferase component of 2-oxoglutarate dehydrogenase complex n=1 Tax=Oceanipulchritudo coccoides TaxID=2706888 RepID=A0A6B2LYP6_9BACT|nr:2-oxoglutarate dehydrogenase complex dihydrolipoyllysine-residue succinyltransferase [Oceanipulchritudo coccoides]NDV61159.1 2-oxoglutarate dehydrogenase complex dihydrolipoyllysine-residue succinyltransferase [Oceanipulchritudo coccoides]
MATEVIIPALGESISSGILATWHVKTGDYVEEGQAIFELETDKITSEGMAETSGTIDLKVSEGDEVEVGSVIAIIDESAKAETTEQEPDSSSQEDSSEEEEGEAESANAKPKGQHPASVRRIAEESGIDPDSVDGTGKAGRVTKADMLAAVEKADPVDPAGSTPESEPAKPAQTVQATGRVTRKKMTPLRRTIAKRLVQAQQTTAMLTTFNEVDMSAVMACRKSHQEAFVKKHGVKLGFMSFFTKAVVHALKEYPAVNAQIDEDEIVTNNYYDVGIAVSTPKGLMVPVVRDCESKSFAEIEQDIIAYANKAKEGKISIEDLQGGVFTITNGGIFGSMLSTPILNAPQSAILGMHTIQDRPVALDGEVVIRPIMYLALSYDHRLVDGREAVGFLVSIKKALEDPMRLMFEI